MMTFKYNGKFPSFDGHEVTQQCKNRIVIFVIDNFSNRLAHLITDFHFITERFAVPTEVSGWEGEYKKDCNIIRVKEEFAPNQYAMVVPKRSPLGPLLSEV